MPVDSNLFSRNPEHLERRASQIQNVACLISDQAVYDEAQRKAQELLDEAQRLREMVEEKRA
jgi:hypothetical protein